jgi:CO/xanthine dehydrogenase Mo-binding subunit
VEEVVAEEGVHLDLLELFFFQKENVKYTPHKKNVKNKYTHVVEVVEVEVEQVLLKIRILRTIIVSNKI